jgi:hypothetical protein
VRVARVQQSLGAFGSATDLAVYDSINSAGQVAFWASNGSSEAIIRTSANPAEHPYITDQVVHRPRLEPDSPLVEYVVTGRHATDGLGNPTARVAFNQIILHATGGRERGDILTLTASEVPGIHYLISREGRVTQIISEDRVANHAGTPAPNTNLYSIGIELVDDGGHRTNPNWATPIQLSKAALLVRDIHLRRGIPLTHPPVLPSALPQHQTSNVTEGWGDRPAVGVPFPNVGDPNYQPGLLRLKNPNAPALGSSFRDGYGANFRGVLAHGQVLNRSGGKDDPRIFDWTAFTARYNQSITFQLNSPANLLVTDPLGRRAGVDPATGLTVLEIPGAIFSGPNVHPQTLELPPSPTGGYAVQVNGTGTGPFRLEMAAAGQDGGLFKTQVSGTAAPGSATDYALNYDAEDSSASRLTGAGNLPPVAVNETFYTNVGTSVTIAVLPNDTDPDGNLDPATVTVTSLPAAGTVNVDPSTGEILYAPPAGFAGAATFTYSVKDNQGAVSNPATVTVIVSSDLAPPTVAHDDQAVTPVNAPVTIDVLANDDPQFGDLLPQTVTVLSAPSNGQAAVNGQTGAITYTPNAGFVGTDTFTYSVLIDEGGESNPATVTVTVTQAQAAVSAVSANWGTAGTAALVNASGGRLLPAGRATSLPWLNFNRLAITLTQSATLTAADVSVTGITVATYGPVSVTGSGTTYTITFAQPAATADRITVTISNAAITTYVRQLDVLPGDTNDDGVVNMGDALLIRNMFLFGAPPTVFGDLDGNGVVTVDDYHLARRRIGTILPPV